MTIKFQAKSHIYPAFKYINIEFGLCCVLQADTLQCYNSSQPTISKCQQSIYCVIRTSLKTSSRHNLTSSVRECAFVMDIYSTALDKQIKS